jgi:Tetracyclin repressor-like, C-terminal domain
MREALERARRRGEVRSGLDVELVLDMLTGPFYYRTLFGHAPISQDMARQVVSYVLRVVDSSGEPKSPASRPINRAAKASSAPSGARRRRSMTNRG